MNSPGWTTGKLGSALSFDGTDRYVSVGNSSALSFPTGDFTISVWVKPTGYGTVLAKGVGNDASNSEYILHINNQGFFFKGAWRLSPALTIPTSGVWTHVAIVYTDSNQTLKFYQNGALSSTLPTISGSYATDTSQGFYLGRQGSGVANIFAGAVDDVRLSKRALSASEIASLASLVGWWKLDEGTGTVAA